MWNLQHNFLLVCYSTRQDASGCNKLHRSHNDPVVVVRYNSGGCTSCYVFYSHLPYPIHVSFRAATAATSTRVINWTIKTAAADACLHPTAISAMCILHVFSVDIRHMLVLNLTHVHYTFHHSTVSSSASISRHITSTGYSTDLLTFSSSCLPVIASSFCDLTVADQVFVAVTIAYLNLSYSVVSFCLSYVGSSSESCVLHGISKNYQIFSVKRR